MAEVIQINVSQGGVPKLPVEYVIITTDGLHEDSQENKKHHGGVDRAVSLWSSEIIQELQKERHPIFYGALGENLTIQGLDWDQLDIGSRLRTGPVELEITDFAVPCWKIKQFFSDQDVTRVGQKHNPGRSRLYAKVLIEGIVCRTDKVEVI